MEIRPGKGVGQLVFGLTESELIRSLGPPDKRYHTASECLRLQYFDLRLECSIEPLNGNRFGWVEVHYPEATLSGRPVVGELIATILPFVSAQLREAPKHEDYGGMETYFYSRSWVEVRAEFGRVAAVNFGVWYDEADEPLWPDLGEVSSDSLSLPE